MPPRVSVVIPVYNRPVALQRAIESVRAQTFQDFEIIVVDDGSTEDTAAVVAAFEDRRIRLISHDRNRGGSAARNTGIRASSAEFIAFLDSDDEWMPPKLERQLNVFTCSDLTLGLVYTGEETVASDQVAERFIPSRHNNLVKTLLLKNVIGGCSLGMIRRTVAEEIGGFDESLTSRQDVDFWLRIAERFRVDFVPEALVRRDITEDKVRISTSISSTMTGWELFLRKYRQKLIEAGVLHLYLRETGWMYHRRARDPIVARRFYEAAIAAKPSSPITYALLLATFVPLPWLGGVARFMRPPALARTTVTLSSSGHDALLTGQPTRNDEAHARR